MSKNQDLEELPVNEVHQYWPREAGAERSLYIVSFSCIASCQDSEDVWFQQELSRNAP